VLSDVAVPYMAPLCSVSQANQDQRGSKTGVTGRPELPWTLSLVVSPPGSESCGEAGAMPQTAAARRSKLQGSHP